MTARHDARSLLRSVQARGGAEPAAALRRLGGVAVSAVICSEKTANLLHPVAESFLLRRLNGITAKMSAVFYNK